MRVAGPQEQQQRIYVDLDLSLCAGNGNSMDWDGNYGPQSLEAI